MADTSAKVRTAAHTTPSARSAPRLLQMYTDKVLPELNKQFGYTNHMAAPRLTKIVLNIGCGEAAHDAKILEEAQRILTVITGQKPVVTRAKKAVANFKIREGDAVGCKVTLRRHRMWEFLERLIGAALPRIRDFRGLPTKSFDASGAYSFGLKEQGIFPELHNEEAQYTLGMDIVIVTTAKTGQEVRVLLEQLGMPFEKKEKDKL